MRHTYWIFTGAALTLILTACDRQPAVAPHQTTETVPVETVPPDPAPATPAPSEDPAKGGAGAADGVVTKFRAVGTEPFWAIDIDGDTAKYMTPDNQTGSSFPVERSAFAKGVEYSGTLNGKPAGITIRSGTCSDGMSDRNYEFTVTATLDGQTLKGCADRN